MTKNTGGPAFPVTSYVNSDGETFESQPQGMTLRDYFAAKAMLPLMGHSGGYWTEENLAAYANTAYAMADAMLKARKA
jgi:hypothetical protein